MKCYNCTSFSSPSSIILSCLVIPNVTIRFFTEIKSSYLLCWGCSFSKLEQTHEDKYLLSTKKKVFPKKKIWETAVPSIRLTKTYLLSMGGAIQSMENKWALMILTDKPSKAKSGH